MKLQGGALQEAAVRKTPAPQHGSSTELTAPERSMALGERKRFFSRREMRPACPALFTEQAGLVMAPEELGARQGLEGCLVRTQRIRLPTMAPPPSLLPRQALTARSLTARGHRRDRSFAGEHAEQLAHLVLIDTDLT